MGVFVRVARTADVQPGQGFCVVCLVCLVEPDQQTNKTNQIN
jgi:hypothetical protein